jgi:fumarate reductase flavoprotein subunit
MSIFSARGGDISMLNSRLHKKLGIEIDEYKVMRDLMKVQGARIHQRIFHLWARNSGRVINWAMEQMEKEGLPTYLVIPTRDEPTIIDQWPTPTSAPPGWKSEDEYTPEYPTCHRISDTEPNNRKWLTIIEKRARERGIKINYNTKAAQLVRDKQTGRVTGVIAQDKDKNYVQYNAAKNVVLASGDYSYNPDMVAKYFPNQGLKIGEIPTSMGEGHQMAMWIGAQMEKPPHAPLNDMAHALGTNAFLFVNRYGERFCDENLDSEAMARQKEEQHGCWVLFDASWPEDCPHFGLGFYRIPRATEKTHKVLKERIDKGSVVVGNTIEELAQKMKVPVDTLKKTIDRYNELVKAGKDWDFGKRPDRLTAIDTAPYYASWSANPDDPMIIFGGLVCNDHLQPVDVNGKVIPGLILAGNTVGGRFKQAYPISCPGISHGMAMTTGYLAGEFAASLT